MIFQVDADTFIDYDPAAKVASVCSKQNLAAEISSAQSEVETIEQPSDEFLLQWAKENYPGYQAGEIKKAALDSRLDKLTDTYTQITAVENG